MMLDAGSKISELYQIKGRLGFGATFWFCCLAKAPAFANSIIAGYSLLG
jgi:hypothetical protein